MTLATGATLGRYQIVAQIGQGGMATVYKAFQPALDRFVALKVLRAGIMDDPEQRERFEREAKAIARLRHPNIVQVLDFDTIDGHSFLVLEFVDGGTLKSKLSELARSGERLPRGEVDRIIREVAEALDTAHAQGIVHRDVKPSNVLLSRAGRAVMADFGIARILAAAQQTQTGVGIGTPEYMSPEQGQGTNIDHRSDIYSLGVMAYELLLGRVPFHADTPLAVVLAHMRDPLPLPSTIDPTIGQTVERVLLKATTKEPAGRYGSAGEFAAALAAALAQPRDAAAPSVAPATSAAASATRAASASAAPSPARVAPARKPSPGAATAARAALRLQIELIARVAGIAFLVLEILLVVRVGLTLASVSAEAQFIALLYGFTGVLVAPFEGLASAIVSGILPDPTQVRIIDIAALIALAVIFAVSRVIDLLLGRIVRLYAVSRY